MNIRLVAASPSLPKAETLMVSFVSNTRTIAVPESANFRYLDYTHGACSFCNHPLQAGGVCLKHGIV